MDSPLMRLREREWFSAPSSTRFCDPVPQKFNLFLIFFFLLISRVLFPWNLAVFRAIDSYQRGVWWILISLTVYWQPRIKPEPLINPQPSIQRLNLFVFFFLFLFFFGYWDALLRMDEMCRRSIGGDWKKTWHWMMKGSLLGCWFSSQALRNARRVSF